MNKIQMVLAALMIFTIAGLSQAQTFYPELKKYSAADKEQLDKTYASILSSKYNGNVENALAVVVMMKLDLPADEFPMIKERIDYLAANGATPVIRSKASLAGAVFARPTIFKEEAARHYDTTDAFFSAVAERADKASLSTN
jgi:hypothetical protein